MPKWIVVVWNVLVSGCTVLAALMFLCMPVLAAVMFRLAVVRPRSLEQLEDHLQVFFVVCAVMSVAYGLHASTLYSRFTRAKLAVLASSTIAVVAGIAYCVASCEGVPDLPGSRIVAWAPYAGPLLFLSVLVALTRMSFWEMGAYLMVRLAFGGAAARARMRKGGTADRDGGGDE